MLKLLKFGKVIKGIDYFFNKEMGNEGGFMINYYIVRGNV